MKNSSLIQTGAWAVAAVGVCSFLYGVLYTVFAVLAPRPAPIIVGPVFYIWLGMSLRKSPGTGQT